MANNKGAALSEGSIDGYDISTHTECKNITPGGFLSGETSNNLVKKDPQC